MFFSTLRTGALFGLAAGLCFPFSAHAAIDSIVVSEIASFESNTDTTSEWIEIYNRSSQAVDISEWHFVESSGDTQNSHRISIPDSVSPVVEPGAYAIIAQNADHFALAYPDIEVQVFDSSWSSLNESGEYIALLDAENNVVESFTYGVAHDHSLQRIDVFVDDYSAMNWVELHGHSAGLPYLSNSEVPLEETQPTDTDTFPDTESSVDDFDNTVSQTSSATSSQALPELPNEDQSLDEKKASSTTRGLGAIRINELVSDPTEFETEWIELINMTPDEIDMSGWSLMDGSNKRFQLSGTLSAHGYLVFESLNFRLNNAGDELTLLDQWGFVIDHMSYGSWIDDTPHDNAPIATKPASLARVQDGISSNNDLNDFSETLTPTRGLANHITAPDSINNTVSDILSETSDQLPNDSDDSSEQTGLSSSQSYSVDGLVLSELFPNPEGSDTQDEFIELHNSTDKLLDISGWSLTDSSHQSFVFASSSIDSFGYLVIRRSESRIALNNSGSEFVSLLRPDGSVADTVSYQASVLPGWSYVLRDGTWSWSTLSTAGSTNVVALPNMKPIASLSTSSQGSAGDSLLLDASDSYDEYDDPLYYSWTFGDRSSRVYSTSSVMEHVYTQPGNFTAHVYVSDGSATSSASQLISILGPTPLEDTAPVLKKKTPITYSSTVRTQARSYQTVQLSDVDALADSSLVITQGTVLVEPGVLGSQIFYIGNPGVEVYMHSRDFPELHTGDVVRVRGEISTPHDFHRIKVRVRDDITIISTATQEFAPDPISVLDVEDERVGDIVAVRGEVVSKKSNELIVESDDGSMQVYAKKSTDIELTPVLGDVVEISGILTKSGSDYRVLPRYNSDVSVVGHAEPEQLDFSSPVQHPYFALGAFAPIAAGGVTGIALSLLWQQRAALLPPGRKRTLLPPTQDRSSNTQ